MFLSRISRKCAMFGPTPAKLHTVADKKCQQWMWQHWQGGSCPHKPAPPEGPSQAHCCRQHSWCPSVVVLPSVKARLHHTQHLAVWAVQLLPHCDSNHDVGYLGVHMYGAVHPLLPCPAGPTVNYCSLVA